MVRVGSSRNAKIASEGTVNGGSFYRMRPFFRDPLGTPRGLDAFTVEYPRPDSVIRAHFHDVDQFQVVISGDGRLGKHPLHPISVHYTDAYTPYGPIKGGGQGLAFMTLRPEPNQGIFYMPGSRDKMLRKAGRGMAVHMAVDPAETVHREGASTQETLVETHPDGLAVYALRAGPGVAATGPDPKDSLGQYFVVANGSAVHEGEELPVFSVLFVYPDQGPYCMTAGANGLDALVLQFPQPRAG